MKKKSIVIVALLVVVAVAAVFFFFRGKSGYLSVIPNDAFVLAKVNVGALLKKSEVLENPEVKGAIAFFEETLDDDAKELLNRVVENPSNCGIDLTEPVVVAVSDSTTPVVLVVAAVSDAGKLADNLDLLLKEQGMDLEKENGVYYVVDALGEKVEVAFDDEKLLFVSNNYGDKGALEFILDTESAKAVNENKFDSFWNSNEDFVFFVDAVAIKPYVEKEYKGVVDYLTTAKLTANFEKGRFVVRTTQEVDSVLLEALESVAKESLNKHLDRVPRDSWAVANFAFNLEPVLDRVSAFFNVDALLQLYGIEKEFIDALSTEYTFALLHYEQMTQLSGAPFMLVADVDEAAFDKLVALCENYLVLKKVDERAYFIDDLDFCLLYKEGALMFIPESLNKNNVNGNTSVSALDNEVIASQKDANLIVDVKALINEIEAIDVLEYEDRMVLEVIKNMDIFESVTSSLISPVEGEFEINFCNKNDNALKSLVYKVIEMYTTLALLK